MMRREFMAASIAAAATAAGTRPGPKPAPGDAPGPESQDQATAPTGGGRLKHSVCQWCFSGMPLEQLAGQAASMGIASIELLAPPQWEIIRAHGLVCAVGGLVPSNPIHSGFNRVENHDAIIRDLETRLPLCREAGVPNQIVMSGNRGGMDDLEGLRNCAKGLRRITPLAESLGVTLVMELLNSKRDHKDYMGDRTRWGADLVAQVASPRFKLLYDIYHMQIMEGDVIATIQEHFDAIAHYHTAGVPGRREIDHTQELNYPAICRAIADRGFQGYFAQEFIPSADPMASLRRAIEICTV